MARIQNRQNKPHLYDDDDDSNNSYSPDLMSNFIVQPHEVLLHCNTEHKKVYKKNVLKFFYIMHHTLSSIYFFHTYCLLKYIYRFIS